MTNHTVDKRLILLDISVYQRKPIEPETKAERSCNHLSGQEQTEPNYWSYSAGQVRQGRQQLAPALPFRHGTRGGPATAKAAAGPCLSILDAPDRLLSVLLSGGGRDRRG